VITYENGVWTTQARVVPGTPQLHFVDIDCATSDCVLVGFTRTDVYDYWRPVALVGHGSSFQLNELALPPDAGPVPTGQLRSVSCQTDDFCVAVGHFSRADEDQPLVETFTAGAWKPSSAPMPADAVDPRWAWLSDVSCPPDAPCTASGTYFADVYTDDTGTPYYSNLAMMTTLSADQFSQTIPAPHPDLADPSSGLGGIVCSGVDACTSLGGMNRDGFYTFVGRTSLGEIQPSMRLALPAGAWDRSVELSKVVADSQTSAVVIGYYRDGNGRPHGLLVTDVPVGP
jgi:hypothetical protein